MLRFFTLCCLALLLTACGSPPQPEIPSPASLPEKVSAKHLPNPVRVHPRVISGGLPAGEEAFAELKELGVKTIISVDGAAPDVAPANKYGLRYVHLPHGYDGISEERTKELAKAVRDLPGPIYIHCHHGKHRSPAAASVACVAAGLIDPAQAVGILKLAGTSDHYRGLYESAEKARPLEAALLDALAAEFPSTAEIPPLAEAMVELEHSFDHLQAIAAAGWRPPQSHPDLSPPHEALLLREHFTELLRTEAVQQEPQEFQQFLTSSEAAAKQLETQLRAWEAEGKTDAPPAQLDFSLDRIQKDCRACHEKYRDVPLSEKQ